MRSAYSKSQGKHNIIQISEILTKQKQNENELTKIIIAGRAPPRSRTRDRVTSPQRSPTSAFSPTPARGPEWTPRLQAQIPVRDYSCIHTKNIRQPKML